MRPRAEAAVDRTVRIQHEYGEGLIRVILKQLQIVAVRRDLADANKLVQQWTNHRVLIDDDEQLTQARLALITAVRSVVCIGLELLGISAPDTM